MQKAKSRLKKSESEEQIIQDKVRSKGKQDPKIILLIKNYLNHLPTLFIAIILWVLLAMMVNTIKPNQVQNLVFINSYLPFLILFFLANFFTVAFILLNSRWGLLVSFLLTTAVFLKFQQVDFHPALLLAPLIAFGILELLLIVFKKMISRKK